MLVTTTTTTTYPGPGRVQRVRGSTSTSCRREGPVKAQLALAAPYDPGRGRRSRDREFDFYVIGVLKGTGRVTPRRAGRPRAARAGGKVSISGQRALELTAPQVTIRADRFETIAQEAFQRFMNSYTWVKGVVQTTTGRLRTLVEHTASLSADSIVERARKRREHRRRRRSVSVRRSDVSRSNESRRPGA